MEDETETNGDAFRQPGRIYVGYDRVDSRWIPIDEIFTLEVVPARTKYKRAMENRWR